MVECKDYKREFEIELQTLYPFLSETEAKVIIEEMIIYWKDVIKSF
jgi:hypothetical protein